jgi:hypothetical protein
MHRLGWLNCYNPQQPIRRYALDLSQPEEREIVKILTILDRDETARFSLERGNDREYEVWLNGEFISIEEKVEPAHGWDLRVLRMKWQRDEKYIPHDGFLSLAYNDEFCYEEARKGQVLHCLSGQLPCARQGAQKPTAEELKIHTAGLDGFLDVERKAYVEEYTMYEEQQQQQMMMQQMLAAPVPAQSGHSSPTGSNSKQIQQEEREGRDQQVQRQRPTTGEQDRRGPAQVPGRTAAPINTMDPPQQQPAQPRPSQQTAASQAPNAQKQETPKPDMQKKQVVKLAPLQGKPNLVPFSEQAK